MLPISRYSFTERARCGLCDCHYCALSRHQLVCRSPQRPAGEPNMGSGWNGGGCADRREAKAANGTEIAAVKTDRGTQGR